VGVVCVAPASAADPHPRLLVVQPNDVPAGFRLDRDESGVRSNAQRAKDAPGFGPLIARSGRITGYEMVFIRLQKKPLRVAFIQSTVDVFRRPDGARIALAWFDGEVGKQAAKASIERSRGKLGAQAWIYTGRAPGRFTLVGWRYRRVVAAVFGLAIPRERVIALARVQQRRIVAAVG
jgi:hypothetical protein